MNILILSGRTHSKEAQLKCLAELEKIAAVTAEDVKTVSERLSNSFSNLNSNMEELHKYSLNAILAAQLLESEIEKVAHQEPNYVNPFYRQYHNKSKWK